MSFVVVLVWIVLFQCACIYAAAYWPWLFCCIRLDDMAERASECAVCTLPVAAGDRVARFRCGHEFHPHCAKTWLHTQFTCPTCRRDVDMTWLV